MNQFYEFKEDNNKNNTSIFKSFIIKIYTWMSLGLMLTSFVSWYTTKIPIIINLLYNSQIFLFNIIILQLILVYLLSNTIFVLNYKIAILLFILYSILNGISLSGIFFVYSLESIFNIFLSTSITFIFMTLYGYFTNNDLTNIGSLLLMLLFGVFVSSIFNILIKSTLFTYFLSYISIFIFTGLIAYDTQKLKYLGNNFLDNKLLNKYSILGALILYLDFVNLFLIPLKIFGKKNNNNKD